MSILERKVMSNGKTKPSQVLRSSHDSNGLRHHCVLRATELNTRAVAAGSDRSVCRLLCHRAETPSGRFVTVAIATQCYRFDRVRSAGQLCQHSILLAPTLLSY